MAMLKIISSNWQYFGMLGMILATGVIVLIAKIKIANLKAEKVELLKEFIALRSRQQQMEKAINADKKYKTEQRKIQEDLAFTLAQNKEILKDVYDNDYNRLIDKLNDLYVRMHRNTNKNN